jgi:hypothetical protein
MPQLSPENYARVSAIVTHETIKLSLGQAFPELPTGKRDGILIDILSQIARRYGYEMRRFVFEEADGE